MKTQGILVILSMGLGDLVFSLPALKTLKQAYPHTTLTLLTHEKNAEFLSLIPEIDSIITYKNKSPFSVITLIRNIRRPHFSKVFVLNPIFRGSLLAWCTGAPVRAGYLHDYERKQSLHGLGSLLLTKVIIPKNQKRHEVDRYLDLLERYGLEIGKGGKTPRLSLNPSLLERSPIPEKNLKKNNIFINLGAGWENRQWPEERIVSLLENILELYNSQIYFCGGTAEFALAERILKKIRGRGMNLCTQTSLPKLAAFLSQSDLFITSDTGSLHIAAALDVPVIALFGPGDLEKVRPQSHKAHVLYHSMPCSPCRFQYTNRCQENLCMKEITVTEVLAAVEKVLGIPLKTMPPPPLNLPKTKKQILYLQSTSEVGGTDVTLLRTLEALDKNLFEAHVLLPKEGPFSNAYRNLGCKVHLLPSMRKMTKRKGIFYVLQFLAGYLPTVFNIVSLVKQESIDLVHTNTIHNLYGFLAAKIAGVPHLWHIREIVMQSAWMRCLEIFLVKHFSAKFIVMDNAISEMFLGETHGYPKNIVKLYDGVNLQKFNPSLSGRRIREDLGLTPDTPLIGTVGRLDPWKGIEGILEAAKLVHAEMPQVHFLLCGGEIEGHEGYVLKLEEKIKSYGLSQNVHITGWKYFGPDIPEVYRALDISVQCPLFPEPYGLANIEAMASGIPTVAVKEGGPVELCLEGETGLLIPPNAPQSLASAIIYLLKNPEEREKMGHAGRKRAENLFDYLQCTRNLEALYADVLSHTKNS